MGVTDIDDKIIGKGRSKGFTKWSEMMAMTRDLEDDFFFDMDRLNVQRPDIILRVTEHMDEIIAYVERLVSQGDAYVTDDGVYFNVAQMQGNYDQFGLNIGQTQTNQSEINNALIALSDDALIPEAVVLDAPSHCKRDPRDFALWKKLAKSTLVSETGNNQYEQPHWDSPWGAGRPGWHIECSAMTHSYFGPHLDIHSGGVDLQFPHHTNEIAQCEAHNCKEHHGGGADWVRAWLHTGHLHIEGRKMSKSLKNFISVQDYFDARLTSQPGDDFRIFCLQYRYSTALNYTPTRINEAAHFRSRVENMLNYTKVLLTAHSNCQGGRGVSFSRKSTTESLALTQSLHTTRAALQQALSDDFDTPRAVKLLADLLGDAAQYAVRTLESVDSPGHDSGRVMHPIEPLVSSVQYVLDTLNMFGLKFSQAHNVNKMLIAPVLARRRVREGAAAKDYSDLDGQGGEGGGAVSSEAIDSALEFRSTIRQCGVSGLKSLKQHKKKITTGDASSFDAAQELESHLLTVMRHCDEARTNLERSFGIKIDDIAGDKSKWRSVK
eukprot:gene21562-27600_t